MTAFQQGYQDALAGRQTNQFALRAVDRDEYLTGYRQGTHECSLEQEQKTRTMAEQYVTYGNIYGLSEEGRGLEIGQATVGIEIPENDDRTPRTDIILHVDAGSYLRHYDEQEGDHEDLANMIRHDAIKAISEMDLRIFVADLVVDRGTHDVITSIVLKDRYEEIENGEEHEAAIEEVAETE
jgi:ribosome modulation factor